MKGGEGWECDFSTGVLDPGSGPGRRIVAVVVTPDLPGIQLHGRLIKLGAERG